MPAPRAWTSGSARGAQADHSVSVGKCEVFKVEERPRVFAQASDVADLYDQSLRVSAVRPGFPVAGRCGGRQWRGGDQADTTVTVLGGAGARRPGEARRKAPSGALACQHGEVPFGGRFTWKDRDRGGHRFIPESILVAEDRRVDGRDGVYGVQPAG